MKKAVKFLCAAAFLLICALVMLFFAPLTETGGSIPMLEWESAEVVGADGSAEAFDMYAVPPELEDGGCYRFSVTLPERSNAELISLGGSAGESRLTLDGAELYAYRAGRHNSTLYITLLPGGGETLVLEVVPEGELGVFPPILQLTSTAASQRENMAYANYYAVPAGAMALVFVLLCGLFLLGLAEGRPDARLLLLCFAAAALILEQLARAFGVLFFPPAAIDIFDWSGWQWLAVLALSAYLALHRSRRYWQLLGSIIGVSAAALLLGVAVSHLHGGYFAKLLSSTLDQLEQGIYVNALSWITKYLLLVCALLSLWELLRAISSSRAEARALALKNELVLENYRAIESKLSATAELRHEFAHRLTLLEAYAEAGEYDALAASLKDWRSESGAALRTRYTENIAVNAILQDAESRAAAAGIEFEAAASVPRELGIPDADLCALLMNMLDNAVEAASALPVGAKRFIRVRIRLSGGFLAVSCVNSYDGRVSTDEHGELVSSKPDVEM